MATNKSGAWRRIPIPPKLKGKSVEAVKTWAREQLNGEEADLKSDEIKQIRAGELSEILLKPKRKGFFLPTGEFVEAMGPIKVNEDLDESDREIEEREEDYAWVDDENTRFNKDLVPDDVGAMRLHWEHGLRIEEYVQSKKRPPYRIHSLLAKRSKKGGYGLRTHQTATDLYRWRPNAAADDPIFSWTWQVADAVLKFSKQNKVRDRVADVIEKELRPRRVKMGTISDFLRGPPEDPEEKPSPSKSSHIWESEHVLDCWNRLGAGNELSPEDCRLLATELLSA